jgi:hypothetical protein
MAVHTESMAGADVTHDHGAEVPDLGALGTRQWDLAQRLRKLHAKATDLVCVSEAGPWGSWLSR